MNIDGSVAGTELGNSFYKSAAVADERMSLNLERKIPIIQMIDACYKTMSSDFEHYGNSCKMESGKRNSCGNYGLAHVGSCSLSAALIW